MESYSQWNQDKYVYERFFPDSKDGFYVDVGAHDGVTGNNTKLFEDHGWDGLLFEPIPHIFNKLIDNRNGVCIDKCAFNKTGTVNFMVNIGYTEMLSGITSTFDPRHLKRIANTQRTRGGVSKTITVETTTVQHELDIINQTCVDFLSVDTEGSELEVLQGIDFDKTIVKVMTIEDNYPNTFESIDQLLRSKGFVFHTKLIGDNIYINSKYYANEV